VIQGAFVMAKATQNRHGAIDRVDHLRHYIKLLFASPSRSRARRGFS
jgi:hypothetical protein